MDPNRFVDEGFVVAQSLLGPRTLRSLRRGADALARAGAHLTQDASLRGAQYRVQSKSGRQGDSAIAPGVFRKIMFAQKAHPAFARLVHDERILAGLAALGLSSPRCVVDQINLKAAHVGTGFPWHQDAAFVTPRVRNDIARLGGVNVAIALDNADETNGGFEVLPGTHRLGLIPFRYDTGGDSDEVFESAAGASRTQVPLAPGDAAFFHPDLAHGSGPNPAGRPRCLIALWYVGQEPGLRIVRPTEIRSIPGEPPPDREHRTTR